MDNNHIEKFFHNSYGECRQAFLDSVNTFKLKGHSVVHEALKVPSKTDDNLFIDTVHVQTRKDNKNLIIISSGLHGIEGFAGSALQTVLTDKLLKNEIICPDLDILFIHAINPWGFKNIRRVNEYNVDLNRNFGIDSDLFKIRNKEYSLINNIINPVKKLSRYSFQTFLFIIQILLVTLFKSRSIVTKAVGEGQYEFDKGIIFGGYEFQEEKILVEESLKKVIVNYSTIIVNDLHTGLGKKGELYLLNAPMANKKVKEYANCLYANKIEKDDNENFYQEHGSFLDFINKLCHLDQICVPVMFEFGTINSHTLKGGIRVMVNLKDENQGYFHGYRKEKDKVSIKKEVRDIITPKDINWRKDVINKYIDTFNLMYNNLEKVRSSA